MKNPLKDTTSSSSHSFKDVLKNIISGSRSKSSSTKSTTGSSFEVGYLKSIAESRTEAGDIQSPTETSNDVSFTDESIEIFFEKPEAETVAKDPKTAAKEKLQSQLDELNTKLVKAEAKTSHRSKKAAVKHITKNANNLVKQYLKIYTDSDCFTGIDSGDLTLINHDFTGKDLSYCKFASLTSCTFKEANITTATFGEECRRAVISNCTFDATKGADTLLKATNCKYAVVIGGCIQNIRFGNVITQNEHGFTSGHKGLKGVTFTNVSFSGMLPSFKDGIFNNVDVRDTYIPNGYTGAAFGSFPQFTNCKFNDGTFYYMTGDMSKNNQFFAPGTRKKEEEATAKLAILEAETLATPVNSESLLALLPKEVAANLGGYYAALVCNNVSPDKAEQHLNKVFTEKATLAQKELAKKQAGNQTEIL